MDDYNNTSIFSKIAPCCYYILCTLGTKHALILQLYTAIGHIAMLITSYLEMLPTLRWRTRNYSPIWSGL